MRFAPLGRHLDSRVQLAALIVLLALTLGFHVALKREPTTQEVDRAAEFYGASTQWTSKIAPDFELTLLDGKPFKLSDRIGKEVIVLNFFATWCVPCRTEMPELNRFHTRQQGKPFVMLGIDALESRELVTKFVNDLGVTFPVAIDNGSVAFSYGVKSYPTTVVIDAGGRIALYETGAILNAEVAFGNLIEEEIKKIAAGRGIKKDRYLAALQDENYRPAPVGDSSEPKLGQRASKLASSMDCVCGCDIKLMNCSCANGTKMKKKLNELAATKQSDVEIKESVNKEFCMTGME